MTIIAMPSPRGTNREGLYLRGGSPVVMAMDSAFVPRRRARDQEEQNGQGDPLAQIKVFLKNRLGPDDFARLEAMFQALSEQDDDPNHNPDPMPDRPQGRDEPPPFRGMPLQRRDTDLLPGTQPNISEVDRREIRSNYAQDARGGSYYDQFPANAFVDVNNYGS